jgi:hypothetical protein
MENPIAPAAKKFPLWAKIILGVVGGIIVIILIALLATSSIVKVADQQLAYLKAGNISAAYDMTASGFKTVMTLEQFTAFVNQYPVLSKNADRSFTNREIMNDQGTIDGTLKATDGTMMAVSYKLIKENGEWKIYGILLNPIIANTDTNTATANSPISEIRVTDDVAGNDYVTAHKAVMTPVGLDLYASALLTNVKKGSIASATLYYLPTNGAIGPASSEVTVDGDFIANFVFTNNEKWPAGDYKISVTLSTGETRDATFKVQ